MISKIGSGISLNSMTSYERTTVGLTPSATFTDKLKLSEGGAGLFVDEVSGKVY